MSGVRAANRVENADAVDAGSVDGPVQVEQVDGAEGVFAAEGGLDAATLDVGKHLEGRLVDVVDVLAGGDDDVDAVNACVAGKLGVL